MKPAAADRRVTVIRSWREREEGEWVTDGRNRDMLFPVCWIASWRTDRKWICSGKLRGNEQRDRRRTPCDNLTYIQLLHLYTHICPITRFTINGTYFTQLLRFVHRIFLISGYTNTHFFQSVSYTNSSLSVQK